MQIGNWLLICAHITLGVHVLALIAVLKPCMLHMVVVFVVFIRGRNRLAHVESHVTTVCAR
jgi:hypothetical protein